MIRGFHAADLFTIANGCCGVGAIFHAMQFVGGAEMHRLDMGAALVPLAAVFDVLDGRVARWRHTHSPMGRELDSLADVISFGVAPAALAFAAGLSSVLDQLALMYFAVCGLSRLARYNITADALATESGKVRYFEGTPITTSVIPLVVTIVLAHRGMLFPISLGGPTFHAVSLLFVISGSLMISKTIHVPKP
jgi:CDP-diacylglycerol--serine O-phosphatidyltransferase